MTYRWIYLVIGLIITLVTVSFSLVWLQSFLQFAKLELSTDNSWWFSHVFTDGKIDGGKLSSVVTTFLYMPLQTVLSFVVFIAAIINIYLFTKQMHQTKLDAATANLSQLIGVIDKNIEIIINEIHEEIIKDEKESDPLEANKKIHRFYDVMANKLPTQMYKQFCDLYGGFDKFGKSNLEGMERLTVDYWGCINRELLGSTCCAKAASYLSLILKTGIESGLDKLKVHKFVFNFLSTKLNAKELDPRNVFLNIYYADMTHNGMSDPELIEFIKYGNSIFKNSLIATNYGDEAQIIFDKMISSKTFPVSSNKRSIKKINIVGNSRVELILRDGKSLFFSVYNESNIIKELNEKEIRDAICDHCYVDDLIFIKNF